MNDAALLVVDGLVKAFGALRASDGVTFDVTSGEIHALIGPNGAGKTTAIAQIFGELKPDAGTVRFAGIDITRFTTVQRAGLGLQRSYQITSLFPEFTALETVALAVQAKTGRSFRFWSPVATDRALREPARAVLERVGLGEVAERRTAQLAHGQQRQLELACVLATQPKMVLLDEPMAGLGPTETQAMTALLSELKGTVTMLLVEHDMDVVFSLADRITVLAKGQAICTGAPDVVKASPDVREAYLGDV
jgi:branched-chain amino acid transport system ATP-binding protein